MSKDMLGSPGGELFGIVHDFVNKLHNGTVTSVEAKRFLRKENPWPPGIVQAVHFDPIIFLGKHWSIEEQDERSLALSEVDLSKVKLITCLREGETSITGEEKLERLKQAGHIRLDARFFLALWQNHKLIPDSWKDRAIYFDGTIFRVPDGSCCVLHLRRHHDEWDWLYSVLEQNWKSTEPSAVLAS